MSVVHALDSVLSESTRSPFLKVIAAVLETVVRDATTACETVFDARRQPTVPIHDYLKRWMKYTRCGVVCVIAAVVLVDRVCKLQRLPISERNVHRFLLGALVVANKYCQDIPFLNSHYAQVGGVPLQEVNSLERNILMLLNFDVNIHAEDMDTYVEMFRNHKSWQTDEDEVVALLQTRSSCKTPVSTRSHLGGDDSTDNGLSETRTSVVSRCTDNGLAPPQRSPSRSSVSSLPAGTGLHAVRAAASPRNKRDRHSLPLPTRE